MALRRCSLASASALRSSAESPGRPVEASSSSGSLQEGQRLAKPGLSGFSSNSSPQIAQVRMGKGIGPFYQASRFGFAGFGRGVDAVKLVELRRWRCQREFMNGKNARQESPERFANIRVKLEEFCLEPNGGAVGIGHDGERDGGEPAEGGL